MKRIYLSPPDVGPDERRLLIEAFDSNWIAPLGPHVDAFEREFCQAVGAQYAVALSSGTAALHLALLLAEFLAAHARRKGQMPVPYAALQRHTARLIAEHRAHWRKNVTEPGAEMTLVEQMLERLAALGLVRRTDGALKPHRRRLESSPQKTPLLRNRALKSRRP